MSKWEKLNNNSPIISAIATIGIAITAYISMIISFLLLVTAICGAIFVWGELEQITEQNKELKKQTGEVIKQTEEVIKQTKITEQSFRQSYRPIFVFDYGEKWESVNPDSDISDIACLKKIENNGNGLLLLIGWLTFVTYDYVDFQTDKIVKIFKDPNITHGLITFDALFHVERYTPIIVNGLKISEIQWSKVDISKECFLHCVYFYIDMNNNLYETISLNYFRNFKMRSEKIEKVTSDIFYREQNVENVSKFNQYFHSYSPEERKELYSYLAPSGYPMIELLK